MNTRTLLHNAALAAFLVSVLVIRGQVPANSSMTIVQTGSGSTSVSINDPGNRVWILQSSPDLRTWAEVEAWKIHNGAFHRPYVNAAEGNLFYRAFFDPARQDILSTVSNALLLPATAYDYSP